MNRRFRMISLTAEALSLEFEDILERDERYEEEFKKEFHEEIRYLMIRESEMSQRKNTAHAPEINLLEEERSFPEKPDHSPIMKELYRSLAKATHPDLHGEESEEEFKEIQTAYSDQDLIKIIAAANRNGIAPAVNDDALEELETLIDKQRGKIASVKKSVRWHWGTSDKSLQARQIVLLSLGIVPNKFYSWKEAELARARLEEKQRREAQEKKMRMQAAKERAERKKEREARRKRASEQKRNPTRMKDLRRAQKKKEQRREQKGS